MSSLSLVDCLCWCSSLFMFLYIVATTYRNKSVQSKLESDAEARRAGRLAAEVADERLKLRNESEVNEWDRRVRHNNDAV